MGIPRLIKGKENLYEYPTELKESQENENSFTIGDLHGNSVKLLHFLLRHKILGFKEGVDSKKAYAHFVTLYNQIPIEELKEYGTLSAQLAADNKTKRFYSDPKVIKQWKINFLNNDPGSTAEEFQQSYDGTVKKISDRIEKNQNKLNDVKAKLQELMPKNLKEQVEHLMSQLTVIQPDKKKLVRLIGDAFADRGRMDYITLRLLDLLKSSGVQVTTLLSNHDLAFISAYENLFKNKNATMVMSTELDPGQATSLLGLNYLAEKGRVTREELTGLVQGAYKPSLKLLDYVLDDEGINLFSHAPVDFNLIKVLANTFGVSYKDATAKELATTIDKINKQFAKIVQRNEIHLYCDSSDIPNVMNMTEEQINKKPLLYLIWNRWSKEKDTDIARRPEALGNGDKIKYIHGHDGYISQYPHVINIDNFSGKMPKDIEHNAELDALKSLRAEEGKDQAMGSYAQSTYKKAQDYVESFQEKVLLAYDANLAPKYSSNFKENMINGSIFIGFVIGCAIGITLTVTGIFAPFGVGIGAILFSGIIPGGILGLISGFVGNEAATVIQPPMDTFQGPGSAGVMSALGEGQDLPEVQNHPQLSEAIEIKEEKDNTNDNIEDDSKRPSL